MTMVTALILEYREAKRHLWASHFQPRVRSLRESGALDCFEEIDRLLFRAIVLESIGRGDQEPRAFGSDAIGCLRVVPRHERVPLMVEEDDRGRWRERPDLGASLAAARLAFVELFEWDRYRWPSFPLVRARIEALAGHPQLVGRDCLIPTDDADIALVDGARPRNQRRGARSNGAASKRGAPRRKEKP
jgi:hypothetical protein